MVTKEEARAAVETPKIALNLARPMTPAEEDEFCQIANGRLNYQSNTDQTREFRAWVKRRPEVRTLISNAVAIFARHSGSRARGSREEVASDRNRETKGEDVL